eukprot:SAG31_NODE_2890_length_4946_cov_19.418816_2_plen_184_part_00
MLRCTTGSDGVAHPREDIATAFGRWKEPNIDALTKRGLKLAMMSVLGYKPTSFEVKTLFAEHAEEHFCSNQDATSTIDCTDDADRRLTLGVSELRFSQLMEQKMQHLQGPDHRLRETFRQFAGGDKGFITLKDLVGAFRKVAPATSLEIIHSVFRELDTRGTGMISYLEFERVFRSGPCNGVS